MKNTLLTIASIISFAAVSLAGDFDLYLQVEQAKRDYATNETARAFLDNLTDDQLLQFADEYIATNSILHQADGKMHGYANYVIVPGGHSLVWKIFQIGKRRGKAAVLCDEYDQKFVDAGVAATFYYDAHATYYPKGIAAWIETNTNLVDISRVFVETSLARREFGIIEKTGEFPQYTLPMSINRAATRMALGFNSAADNGKLIKSVVSGAVKPIKRRLREKGISFVVQEGEANPVQEAIDALTAAFNAPKLAGLKEWVANWFPEYQWVDIDRFFMSDEEMTKLCDDIYYGDKDLTAKNSALILSHLGLDGYNAFIERYNGDAN